MSYNGADLIFPHLNIVIQHLKNHITVFGFDIAFYGIIIGVGLLVGLFITEADARRRGDNPELYVDFIIYAIIFSILCARLFYVTFNWDYYRGDLMKIINIRQGGLAIYGSITGSFLTAYVFCKRRKFPFLRLSDSGVLGLIAGQCIGRWGNFFNCEAFGGYTDSLFAMRMKESLVNSSMITSEIAEHAIIDEGIRYIQVHPTFLYESFWDLLVLLFLLWFARKKQSFTGQITLLYFLCYAFGRFFIEGIRTDQLIIPGTNLPVSQCISVVLVILSCFLLWYLPRRENQKALEKLQAEVLSDKQDEQ